MAKIEGRTQIHAEITFILTEQEAAALDALAGYGDDVFLKCFYEHMGRAYLQPHEAGLRSLLRSVRTGEASVGRVLERFKNARMVAQGLREVGPEVNG